MKHKDVVKKSSFSTENKNNDFYKLAHSLIGSFNKEINIYSRLYELIKNEKETLRNASINDLNVNNSMKEKCLVKARICHSCREELLREFKKKYLTDYSRKIKITHILFYLDNDIKRQLTESREKLYILANAVKKINFQNKIIIMNSIFYKRSSLKYLLNNSSLQINYRKSGLMDISLSSGAILNRNI